MFVLDFKARFMNLSRFIFIIFVIDQPIIAYIHDLCDLRASANNNLYFNLKLQTKEESFRAVCYSPDKHKIFKAKAETASS